MKQKVVALLQQAVEELIEQSVLQSDWIPEISVERTRDAQHGDFASNLAMMLAKSAKTAPRQLAEAIIAALPDDVSVEKVEIAGPGFINFFVNPAAQHQIIADILRLGPSFGKSEVGAGKKVQVEFVSANPTGPLHVGHGRGAVYGSVVAELLRAVGYDVANEYYVNDAGRQMDILATSIWLRYLECCGQTIQFPSNGYRGGYVEDIARQFFDRVNQDFCFVAAEVFDGVPVDEPQGGDKEQHVDGLISKARELLGQERYTQIFQAGLTAILADIRDDLAEFGVDYQHWFFESLLVDDGSIEAALERLDKAGHLYKKEGATWFASSLLGDEKDRVVVRENGQSTYFASDIAYHMNKLDRGFERIINVWGSDHHGYVPRVRAAMTALGADADKLEVLLVQFAVLYRGAEKVPMSTRSGDFVTLRHLRDEVGVDAARFFYVLRKSDQHMDFDLKLATSQTNDNPVFYVQYAYARICSVLRQLEEKGLSRNRQQGLESLELLSTEHEVSLIGLLTQYPEVLERSALKYEPHHLVHFLRELANHFHTYYNAQQFLVDDVKLRDARINLIEAIQQCLSNGLGLLGVNSPESM
ncbi:MAG: arginine--tRNA ligase [Methylococcales bacterium]|nr:arginine--tRNA ligase [Methylococcales bacterium]MBT3698698.1 arginine--tRNA ligase [Methylococcales bacterium]MBT4032496.1 arginine--tRNA ligase [Methylococcales bacterium]MBT4663987.1 arginine--tRNA ligase [Methylococcales bacterium]MBT5436329.1 arginine--tRNA ligase [Methylococcales bacterium]